MNRKEKKRDRDTERKKKHDESNEDQNRNKESQNLKQNECHGVCISILWFGIHLHIEYIKIKSSTDAMSTDHCYNFLLQNLKNILQ